MDEKYLDITTSLRIPLSEIKFRTSRSSGPGGQNVNKLETRVELLFDVVCSDSLLEESRFRILEKLKSSISPSGCLRIVVQESRSQWKNKQLALEKFIFLLRKALSKQKKRIHTRPTTVSQVMRLQSKKTRSKIKHLRRKVLGENE